MKSNQSISFVIFFSLLILFSGCLFAQGGSRHSFMEFKVGYLKPEDASGSNMLGFSVGRKLDDKLYYGAEANYISSTYRRTTTIAVIDSGGVRVTDKQLELDFRTRILSLLLQISYETRLDSAGTVYFRASGGGGMYFVWNDENNYIDNIQRTRNFNGLGWQLTTGLGMPISRTGMIFIDAVYNYALLSKKLNDNEFGLPTFREINLSGFGVRAGINLIGVGM
jgi:hypothetical protein